MTKETEEKKCCKNKMQINFFERQWSIKTQSLRHFFYYKCLNIIYSWNGFYVQQNLIISKCMWIWVLVRRENEHINTHHGPEQKNKIRQNVFFILFFQLSTKKKKIVVIECWFSTGTREIKSKQPKWILWMKNHKSTEGKIVQFKFIFNICYATRQKIWNIHRFLFVATEFIQSVAKWKHK